MDIHVQIEIYEMVSLTVRDEQMWVVARSFDVWLVYGQSYYAWCTWYDSLSTTL